MLGMTLRYRVKEVVLLQQYLKEAAQKAGWRAEVLSASGAECEPILLFSPATVDPAKPMRLVAAGLHGNEIGGVWGILRYLSERPSPRSNLYFLPCVSISALRAQTHLNAAGEDVNRGYAHAARLQHTPSAEGRVLQAHWPRLLKLARDGFLALHEDADEDKVFHLYTFEPGDEPGYFTLALWDAARKYFDPRPEDKPLPDKTRPEDDIRAGVDFLGHDGSMEDALFDDGVPYSACADLPGRAPDPERGAAACAVLQAFDAFPPPDNPAGLSNLQKAWGR